MACCGGQIDVGLASCVGSIDDGTRARNCRQAPLQDVFPSAIFVS